MARCINQSINWSIWKQFKFEQIISYNNNSMLVNKLYKDTKYFKFQVSGKNVISFIDLSATFHNIIPYNSTSKIQTWFTYFLSCQRNMVMVMLTSILRMNILVTFKQAWFLGLNCSDLHYSYCAFQFSTNAVCSFHMSWDVSLQ